MTRCSAPTARSGILAPVGEQDQLFRMTVGGAPVQVVDFKGDISGFKVSADGNRLIVWADRDLRCTDFACDGLPQGREERVGPRLRPAVRPPLGHMGRAGRPLAASSPSRSRAAR